MLIAVIQKIEDNKTELLRFLAVGLSGTIVDFGLLVVLKVAGLPTLLANTFSFSAGTLNNFTWNRLWTFEDARIQSWQPQLIKFAVVSLIGLTLNNAIVLGMEMILGDALGWGNWRVFPAKALATGFIVIWNYLANKAWTFKPIEG
jgi:putative flippase GtrA